MFGFTMKRVLVYTMALHLALLGFLPAAQADVVGTQTLLQLDEREARLSRINSALTREDVRREMLALGAAPDQVQERLAALTDEELQVIDAHLDELPAGGSVVAVIGVVFIVLIILELVGVTNIFTKF